MAILEGKFVIISRCPLCRGVKLYAFEEFMDADDRAELERLRALGFRAERFIFKQATAASDCNCQEAKVAAYSTSIQSKNARPKLSLKRSDEAN